MFRHFRNVKEDREEGFTLIEILVVIIIIGILASIAIWFFLGQKKKANDATLKSDLSTVAIQMQTYLLDTSAEEAVEEIGKTRSIVEGEGAENLESKAVKWNEVESLPNLTISPGNTIEITVKDKPSSTAWTDSFDNGEFCLAGTSPRSTYDYVPGSGKKADYNKYLFYDVRAGGIRTIEELQETNNNNEGAITCKGYLSAWESAGN